MGARAKVASYSCSCSQSHLLAARCSGDFETREGSLAKTTPPGGRSKALEGSNHPARQVCRDWSEQTRQGPGPRSDDRDLRGPSSTKPEKPGEGGGGGGGGGGAAGASATVSDSD